MMNKMILIVDDEIHRVRNVLLNTELARADAKRQTEQLREVEDLDVGLLAELLLGPDLVHLETGMTGRAFGCDDVSAGQLGGFQNVQHQLRRWW